MSKCGLCGEDTETLYEANIEGAMMNVCDNCGKLGRVIKEIKIKKETYQDYDNTSNDTSNYNNNSDDKTEVVVPDFGKIIKKARENRGLKQEDFAKMLAIKESLLHNIESGHFKPSMPLVLKLQKYLHVKLTTVVNTSMPKMQQSDSGPMTLGDMIKIKKK